MLIVFSFSNICALKSFRVYLWTISGTSGSDSPGQAVEAEEIVKQLDMEQVDEITTSTTSANGAAYSSQAVQVRPSINNGLEEAEETVTRDIPPLTGE